MAPFLVADTRTSWRGAELGLGTKSGELERLPSANDSNKLEVTSVSIQNSWTVVNTGVYGGQIKDGGRVIGLIKRYNDREQNPSKKSESSEQSQSRSRTVILASLFKFVFDR